MKIKLDFVVQAKFAASVDRDVDEYSFRTEVELCSEWEILHIPVRAGMP